MNAINRAKFHDRKIAPVVENWLQNLLSEFQQGIENSAVESERALGNDVEDCAWSWADIATIGGGAAVTTGPAGGNSARDQCCHGYPAQP